MKVVKRDSRSIELMNIEQSGKMELSKKQQNKSQQSQKYQSNNSLSEEYKIAKQQNQVPEENVQYEKRGYLKEDFRIFYLEDIAAREIEYHYHDFDKILVFFKGNITYTIEGKAYALMPGDIILVPQGDSHKVEVAKDTDQNHKMDKVIEDRESSLKQNAEYKRLVIYLSPQYLTQIREEGVNLRECFLKVKERYSNVVRLKERGENNLIILAEQMQKEVKKKEDQPFDNLYIRTYLLQFLISLNRMIAGENIHFVDTSRCNKKMVEIIQYINNHLTEEISIDSLADIFYISKYHMMRQFKSETGYTIGNYINQKRLLLARALLKQGESVTKVYLDCGFKDYSTFVRAYKQMFHEVPSKRGKIEKNGGTKNALRDR